MAGLFDTLQIAGNALITQQAAAQTVGANIANANVAGYHREDVTLQSGAAFTGVERATFARSQDLTLEQTLATQLGNSGFADKRMSGLTEVQNAVGDISESGLAATLGRFYASWRTLSAYPADVSARTDVLANSQALVQRTHQMAGALQTARTEADDNVVSLVADANKNITAIAALNGQITAAEATGGPQASDLRDKRDLLAGQLATQIGVKAITDENSQASITLNGVSLVSGQNANLLAPIADQSTIHHIQIQKTTQGSMDARITSGTMGALLRQRDTVLTGYQASLDQFASDTATAVNTIHKTGYGLDGTTGHDLFLQPASVNGAARLMALDPAVLGQPAAVATAAAKTTLPRDNAIAVLMGELEGSLVATGATQTLGESAAELAAMSGRDLQLAESNKTLSDFQLTQVQNLWQRENGISLQEQMLQLTKYQSAYQAAVKLVSVADSMLGSLLRL